MLRENPKKERKEKKKVDYAHPTKMQLFWRVQRECWRRMVTPFLMYLFTSLLAFACEAIDPDTTTTIEIILGSICIAGGAFFNAHLCYHYGLMHYDAYLTGALHRKNELFGIQSGGDHHVEREYRPWKGFLIGFFIGVPVLVIAAFTPLFPNVAGPGLTMFAAWSILPIKWVSKETPSIYAMVMIVLPIIVSGVAYIVGAYVERDKKAKESERDEQVREAGKKAKDK